MVKYVPQSLSLSIDCFIIFELCAKFGNNQCNNSWSLNFDHQSNRQNSHTTESFKIDCDEDGPRKAVRSQLGPAVKAGSGLV